MHKYEDAGQRKKDDYVQIFALIMHSTPSCPKLRSYRVVSRSAKSIFYRRINILPSLPL